MKTYRTIAGVAQIFCLLFTFSCIGNGKARVIEPSQCSEYQITLDRKDTQIVGLVSFDVSESDLKCILIQIADKHQYDKDRDYLGSDYLWIILHLKRDGLQSKLPAAKLRRYVQLDKSRTDYVDEDNRFYLTPTEARESF